MGKIVLVETISTFRHLYAIEVADDEPIEHALDDVVDAATGGETDLQDFAQNHVAEDILSYRQITEEEFVKIFDKENDYLAHWSVDQKKGYIFKRTK